MMIEKQKVLLTLHRRYSMLLAFEKHNEHVPCANL